MTQAFGSRRWTWARAVSLLGIIPVFLGLGYLVIESYRKAIMFWLAGLVTVGIAYVGVGAMAISLGGSPGPWAALFPLAVIAGLSLAAYAALDIDRLYKASKDIAEP